MRTFRLVASALVACAALSACGGQGAGDPAPTPSATGGTPVTTPPSTDPTDPTGPTAPLPPTAVPPTKRTPGGPSVPPGPGGVELTGTVQGGVEPGCLLLDTYQLIGGPRDVLKAGAKVTVTGRPQPDMMTTCQQGTPFVVESARPA